MLEPGHGGAAQESVGTPPLCQAEVSATLSEAIGRPVTVELISRDGKGQKAEVADLSAHAIETLMAMFEYCEDSGLCGNHCVWRWVLGCEPISLLEFARTNLHK